MNCLLKDSKANQRRNTVSIKFGINIHRDHKEAMMCDANNGNINWKYADLLELKQTYNFDLFNYIRPIISAHIPPKHTKI